MSNKLFVAVNDFDNAYIGTLGEVLEWAADNCASLEDLYIVGEKVDVKALIEEKYSD